MSNKLKHLSVVANRDKKIPIKREDLHGRTHYVVPMIMLTEGVHKGSSGPGYYSREEVEKDPQAWDHKPIVIYHPVANDGSPKTACDPVVLESSQVGIILNSSAGDGKLRAEAWLDEERLNKVDKRVVEAIEKGEMVEVSTGLRSYADETPGVWNNERYDWKMLGASPDHLAILPDQKGACSIADGAGLMRVNSEQKDADGVSIYGQQLIRFLALSGIEAKLTANELSFSEIQQKLNDQLGSKFGEKGKYWCGYICHVYSDSVVFNDDKGAYYQIGYSVSDNKVSLANEAVKVEREVVYKPVNNIQEKEMTKEEKKAIIDKLIANGVYEEKDRPELEALKESLLQKIPLKEEAKPVVNKENVEKKIVVANKEEEKPAPVLKEKAPLTEEEFWAMAPPSLRMQHNKALEAAEKERNRLIETIVANANNPFSEEYLKSKEVSIELLQGMAQLASSSDNGPIPMFHGGAGGFVSNKEKYAPKGLVVPEIEFAKRA